MQIGENQSVDIFFKSQTSWFRDYLIFNSWALSTLDYAIACMVRQHVKRLFILADAFIQSEVWVKEKSIQVQHWAVKGYGCEIQTRNLLLWYVWNQPKQLVLRWPFYLLLNTKNIRTKYNSNVLAVQRAGQK